MKICPKCGHHEPVRVCYACLQPIGSSHKWTRTILGFRHWSCGEPTGYGGIDWRDRQRISRARQTPDPGC